MQFAAHNTTWRPLGEIYGEHPHTRDVGFQSGKWHRVRELHAAYASQHMHTYAAAVQRTDGLPLLQVLQRRFHILVLCAFTCARVARCMCVCGESCNRIELQQRRGVLPTGVLTLNGNPSTVAGESRRRSGQHSSEHAERSASAHVSLTDVERKHTRSGRAAGAGGRTDLFRCTLRGGVGGKRRSPRCRES